MPQAVRDYEIQEVGDDEVDYELPSANALTGSHANLIPIPGNVQSTRVFYGARFFNQSLPVVGGEAPLVQSLIDNDVDGRSFDDHYGERAGAVRADDDYEVLEVLRDRLRLKNSRNEVVEKELYDELPFNRKSMITHRPLVKPGDKVTRGRTLAASNYTDDNGTLAMGLNARIGIVPYKGYSMDDAVVVRQGFADRLRSQTTETFKQDRDEQNVVNRNHFHSLFPDKFTKDQLSLVDDDGVIKPGTIIQPGDPMILATRPRVLSSTSGELGKLSKTMRQVRSDASQVWEGDGPARVMKVAKTKKGVKVVVLQERGTKEGDKITLRHGQKGTVSLILPDDHMPRTTDGEPLDMMLNPQGMPSRANFSTLYELLLGKVAKKKGAPIKLPMFLPPGVEMYDYVEQQLKEAGLTDVEEVFDPQDNRKLENPIAVGMGFIQKLHHTSASKADARGQGSYDLNQQPAKGGEGGAKRLSGLETHALMSSGAYATLREGATLRGQKNDDYWRMLRAGHTPRDPDEPFVWKKFRGLMAGAGLRMRDEAGGKNRLGPMTDDDVDAYKPLEVRNGRTLDLRTLEPEKGGLFDQALVGNNMWGKITLPEPVLNPAFEGSARHLLGLKLKDLQAILAGEMELPEEMQRRIAERVRLMTKDAGWAQSLGSALSSRTGRLVRNTAAGTAAGGALGAGAAMVKTDTVPEIQSKGRVTSYDGTFGSPAAVKPLGFLDWFKDPATFAEYSKKYVGHYTPRQFMGGYGEQLDSEIGKAKAYQDRLRQQPGGEQFPALDYSQIDTAVPVLAHEDGAVDDSMFEQYNDGTRQVRVSDGSKPLSPLSARINRTTPEELSPANVLTHEMRHAWQAAAPGTEHPPILPQYSTLEKQDQPHGLRTSEQLGWLGGLQHELFKQRGSRMETPEEARALIQQAVSSEPEFLQQYPIENTEVLRGIRWLKYLKQQSTDSYRGETERAAAAQQYEQMLEWLSKFAPATVSTGEPDEQAIKMGSVQPVFYDPQFEKAAAARPAIPKPLHRDPAWEAPAVTAQATPSAEPATSAPGLVNNSQPNIKYEGHYAPRQFIEPYYGKEYQTEVQKAQDYYRRELENRPRYEPENVHQRGRFWGLFGGRELGMAETYKPTHPDAPPSVFPPLDYTRLDQPLPVFSTPGQKSFQHPAGIVVSNKSVPPSPEQRAYNLMGPKSVADAPETQARTALEHEMRHQWIESPQTQAWDGFDREQGLGKRYPEDGIPLAAPISAGLPIIDADDSPEYEVSWGEGQRIRQNPKTGLNDFSYWSDSLDPVGRVEDRYGALPSDLPAYEHGLSRAEQMGWASGLQQALYLRNGRRLETPEEAKAYLDRVVKTLEPEEFEQEVSDFPNDSARGLRYLRDLQLRVPEDYKWIEKLPGEQGTPPADNYMRWLSTLLPALVGNGQPDEQAIKMGSVRPAFYDPDFKTEPTPAFNVPKTGPDAIHLALAALDLDELEKAQKDLVASGKVSKRNGAIQTLNAISGLRANNVRPEQLMITKVPVVPPAFRPFALVGETFIPGDANELYKDLFDLKETLAEAKQNFGDEGAVAERRAFQAAVKAVYGYGDPVNPKSQQRGVSGFLRQISGSNPKFSFFQRKLISKTQDQVGRGVITPDPELTLDEIGIPEDMAWEMYGTYIMRRLVRDGMQRAEALRQIKDRSKFARQALEKELPERPVVYSRSPAWHKYNIISGTPRLIEGDTIRISPFVAAGLGADYDGDTVNLHVPASPDAVREAKEILRPSNMLFSIKDDEKVVPKLVQEQILGPYAASQRPSKAVHTFPDRESALKAIRTGQISLSDEIEFPDIPVKAKVAATLEAMRNRC